MNLMYPSVRLPKDDEVISQVRRGAIKLLNKLQGLSLAPLNISDYNRRYAQDYLDNPIQTLQKYSFVLAWCLGKISVPLDRFVLVDYGGGSGILSLLARETGIGIVIYVDIYDVSCHDAREIAQAVGSEADFYVEGDIDDLTTFLASSGLVCDGVVSNDVIEHVYDIRAFLKGIAHLSSGPLSVAMATGANPFNPQIQRMLTETHLKAEHEDRAEVWGHKQRDSLKAYLSIRRDMIASYAKEAGYLLQDVEIEYLAKNTRGLIESDIRKVVDEYLETGRLSVTCDHPTNTCDPYTGNWAERLMDPYELTKTLSEEGFQVQVLPGFRGYSKRIISTVKTGIINSMIYVLGERGLPIAPFYIIHGRRI